MSDAVYQELASMRSATLGGDANIAALMLRKCRRLHRIHFSIGRREEISHVLWLRTMTGYSKTTVEFVHDNYWVLRSASVASTSEWHTVLLTAVKDHASYRALFPVLEEGKRRCIDVDFGINRVKKEMGSGVGQRAIR